MFASHPNERDRIERLSVCQDRKSLVNITCIFCFVSLPNDIVHDMGFVFMTRLKHFMRKSRPHTRLIARLMLNHAVKHLQW